MAEFGSVKARAGKAGCPLASAVPSPIPFKDGWTAEAIFELRKRGLKRPDPREYLDETYIEDHLSKFDKGASYIVSKDVLDDWKKKNQHESVGTPNGLFIMPTAELDALLARADGDMSIVKKELGLPENSLKGELVRVDIPNPRENGIRMASGNEDSANKSWLPGGKLPNGGNEAVINPVPFGSYNEVHVEKK